MEAGKPAPPAAPPTPRDTHQKQMPTCAVSLPGGPGALEPPMPTESSEAQEKAEAARDAALLRAQEAERQLQHEERKREVMQEYEARAAAATQRLEEVRAALRWVDRALCVAAANFAHATALPQLSVTPGGQFIDAVLGVVEAARRALAGETGTGRGLPASEGDE